MRKKPVKSKEKKVKAWTDAAFVLPQTYTIDMVGLLPPNANIVSNRPLDVHFDNMLGTLTRRRGT